MSTQTLTTTDKQAPTERAVEFTPFGSDAAIKLTITMVQSIVATPTRLGHKPSDADCIKFMMLCKARHLNPFEGDAYLLGYDTNDGPKFSLITAHQVFLKRAEAEPQYDGMESGVIVLDKDGSIIEREGDFTVKGETLVGGWAKVYRRDRTRPMYRRLKLETFSTGKSRWAIDPAGMIVKCAEADALRSTFPTHLGGLYAREERREIEEGQAPTIRFEVARPLFDAKKPQFLSAPAAPKPAADTAPPAAAAPEPPADAGFALSDDPPTPLEEIRTWLKRDDLTEAALMKYLAKNNYVPAKAKTLADLDADTLAKVHGSYAGLEPEIERSF